MDMCRRRQSVGSSRCCRSQSSMNGPGVAKGACPENERAISRFEVLVMLAMKRVATAPTDIHG